MSKTGVKEVFQIRVGPSIHDDDMDAMSAKENARIDDQVTFLNKKNKKITVSTARSPKKFATP